MFAVFGLVMRLGLEDACNQFPRGTPQTPSVLCEFGHVRAPWGPDIIDASPGSVHPIRLQIAAFTRVVSEAENSLLRNNFRDVEISA
jgi:hypothetical protein